VSPGFTCSEDELVAPTAKLARIGAANINDIYNVDRDKSYCSRIKRMEASVLYRGRVNCLLVVKQALSG
jgi:hypothetical protein